MEAPEPICAGWADEDWDEFLAEVAALELRRSAINAVAKRKADELKRRAAALLDPVREEAAEWVAARIPEGKKSIGRIDYLAGFRATGGGPVVDGEALLAWCEANGLTPVMQIDVTATLARHFEAVGEVYVDRHTGKALPAEVATLAEPTQVFYVGARRTRDREEPADLFGDE